MSVEAVEDSSGLSEVQAERYGSMVRAGSYFLLSVVGMIVASEPFKITTFAVGFLLLVNHEANNPKLIDLDNPKELDALRVKVLSVPLNNIFDKSSKYSKWYDTEIVSQSEWQEKYFQETKGRSFLEIYQNYDWKDLTKLFSGDEGKQLREIWEAMKPIDESSVSTHYSCCREAIIDVNSRWKMMPPVPMFYKKGDIVKREITTTKLFGLSISEPRLFLRVTDWAAAQPGIEQVNREEKEALEQLRQKFALESKRGEGLYRNFVEGK